MFKRLAEPAHVAMGDELTAAMVGIGMNFGFSGRPDTKANIEDTLMAASVEGMERDDYRVLGVLVTWLGVHVERVNADRLVQLVQAHPSPRVRCFWTSIARWKATDTRLGRLKRMRHPRTELLRVGNDFQMERKGPDPRFAAGPLDVPAGVLRDRPDDVYTPGELARRHAVYRARVMFGPLYRADMWAALEDSPELSPTELAHRTYGSFSTAWHARRDWALLRAKAS
jgi:hypothetical protein